MDLSSRERQLIALITQAAVALLALYNGFVAPLYGWPMVEIGSEEVNSVVCLAVALGIAVWNAWKNRNFTYAAQLSQLVLEAVKSGVLAPEAVEELLDEANEEFNGTLEDLDEEIEQEVEEFLEHIDEKEGEQDDQI